MAMLPKKKQDFVAAVLLCFFVCFFLRTSVASALSFFVLFVEYLCVPRL